LIDLFYIFTLYIIESLTVSSVRSTKNKREVTRVFYGVETVISTVIEFLNQTSNVVYACVDQTRPILTLDILVLKNAFLDAKNRGIKLLYITEITKDNLTYCKELMKMTHELRHLDGIKGNFYISESGYLAPATYHEKGKPASQIIYSNVNEIIEHQKYVFDSFWNRAIPAEQRINEVEQGIILGKTEVIQNPQTIQELFLNMVKSAKQEILLLLPTVNAFLREERLGIIQLLEQAASEDGVNVRILGPTNDTIENRLKDITVREGEEGGEKKRRNFDFRSINTPFEEFAVSTVTIVVIDKKESLVFEKVDDSKDNLIEALGLATNSNSKPTVMSYISIFESLWKQVQLYEQLEAHDKMQREFINIASHEMRTPTQAILGYAELLERYPEKREEVYTIKRNAERLQRLTTDILEVARIESQTLRLNKERVNLSEKILNVLKDVKNQIPSSSTLKILFTEPREPIYVQADKLRIYEVIANLLTNAIKFTKEGTINIIANAKNNDSKEVIISIKDTGAGINPEILPRLFTKFATKSDIGTGLGLYISKGIVEAHGGKIWAENNPDGKGATFTFTLPVMN
jgi:two-component system, OmpR family, sensor histidine kinase VicK